MKFRAEQGAKALKEIILAQYLTPAEVKPALPPKTRGALTLVFELHQTLLYSFYPDWREAYLNAPLRRPDLTANYDEHGVELSLYLRPQLLSFLASLRESHELVLYTSGIKSYTDLVLKETGLLGFFQHTLTQEHCPRLIVEEEELDEYVKDLGGLGRDLSKLVYLDSNTVGGWLCPDNVITFMPYRGEEEHADSLASIQDDITMVSACNDVREVLRDRFQIRRHMRECLIFPP